MDKLVLTGEVRRVDGATYPVEYTYNALGNQTFVIVKGRNDGEITTSSMYRDGE